MKIRKLAPSILSADLLKLEEQIKIVEANGADFIHVDVMDGHFVPNITFGPVIVKTLKRITKLPLDVHLMIENAGLYVEEFAAAGAAYITVHQEALRHLHRVIQQIRNAGARPGISLNPATDISTILPVLAQVDLILLMTVNPGFGGQKFLEFVIDKIRALAEIKQEMEYDFLIEVDGGIDPGTAGQVLDAGAEVLVAGNAIFGQANIAAACRKLRDALDNK
jgi:ribulose-phosphate 3-epimerase